MSTVEVGNNIEVHYIGTLADGTEFDNSYVRGEPIKFEAGAGNMIGGFDRAVLGMNKGETKSFTLSPEEAYGERVPNAIQNVSKEAFGPGYDFVVGTTVQGRGPQGAFLATIHAVDETSVQLDMNHPLAGKELTFNVEVVEIYTTASSAAATMLEGLKVAELRAVAKERGLKGYTKLKKAELLELLGA
jgi:peptidylprolyl isomerase